MMNWKEVAMALSWQLPEQTIKSQKASGIWLNLGPSRHKARLKCPVCTDIFNVTLKHLPALHGPSYHHSLLSQLPLENDLL